jgi:hypothetical protein
MGRSGQRFGDAVWGQLKDANLQPVAAYDAYGFELIRNKVRH